MNKVINKIYAGRTLLPDPLGIQALPPVHFCYQSGKNFIHLNRKTYAFEKNHRDFSRCILSQKYSPISVFFLLSGRFPPVKRRQKRFSASRPSFLPYSLTKQPMTIRILSFLVLFSYHSNIRPTFPAGFPFPPAFFSCIFINVTASLPPAFCSPCQLVNPLPLGTCAAVVSSIPCPWGYVPQLSRQSPVLGKTALRFSCLFPTLGGDMFRSCFVNPLFSGIRLCGFLVYSLSVAIHFKIFSSIFFYGRVFPDVPFVYVFLILSLFSKNFNQLHFAFCHLNIPFANSTNSRAAPEQLRGGFFLFYRAQSADSDSKTPFGP